MRQIPAQLLQHKKQEATTLCQLIKIKAKNGTVIGMTSLDQDVMYDDGQGMMLYRAPVGFQPASIYQAIGFEVNSTEFQSLVVPEFDFDLNEFDVNSGVYDYAEFYVYEINYEDHSMGHWIVMHGQMGQMKSHDGIQMFGELRGISDLFRRNVIQLDSLSCRAKFGSTYADEKFPCLYNAEVLWNSGTVTNVGIENTRVFNDTSRTEADGFYMPGLLQFLSGKNAGKYVEIESFGATEITLSFMTSYPIYVGDTYRIRRDCNKQARDGAKGCKHWYGQQWGLHFRGEPDIPVGDMGTLTTPTRGGNDITTINEEPEND